MLQNNVWLRIKTYGIHHSPGDRASYFFQLQLAELQQSASEIQNKYWQTLYELQKYLLFPHYYHALYFFPLFTCVNTQLLIVLNGVKYNKGANPFPVIAHTLYNLFSQYVALSFILQLYTKASKQTVPFF
jgi:hypothetical protein